MRRYRTLRLDWECPAPELADHVRFVLERWSGTKYRLNKCNPGVEADCIGLVRGILDDLYDREPSNKRTLLRGDVALHDPDSAKGVFREFLEEYPSERIRDGVVHPGDVLVQCPTPDVPMHAQIVADRPRSLFHCTKTDGAHYAAFVSPPGVEVSAWRPLNKESWIDG